MRDRLEFIVNKQLRRHHDETCVRTPRTIEFTADLDLRLTERQQKAIDRTQKK